MSLTPSECCILNAGDGSWAFEPLAVKLSETLGIDVSSSPRRFNYLLASDRLEDVALVQSFIPVNAIELASDKRLLAIVFNAHAVPTPTTQLVETFSEVQLIVGAQRDKEWCLKYPTSCGANGHRQLTVDSAHPPNWPAPFVVQELIRLESPEVYRTYCAGGEIFGWVARRFPNGVPASPWVAHAKGARYVQLDDIPGAAREAARIAFVATNLLSSFGCVDLLCKPSGEWVVLEVGTDGLFNHVDRDLGDPSFERFINQKIAAAFWTAARRFVPAGNS